MATKKVTTTSPLPIDPHSLPEDGTPVSFTQTFAKHVGSGRTEEERILTAEDYEDEEWEVRRQTVDGWEFVEKVEGMPLDNELRENYGAGKYELTPVDPRSGKAITKLRKVRLISSTISPTASGGMGMRDEPAYPSMPMMGMGMGGGGEEVPAWMRWQMQQAAEERAEQRRRAEDALVRQKEFEEKLALREFERMEREERERKRRDDLAADEARRRDERFSQMLTAGLGLAQAFLSSKGQPQQRDVNEVLLRELMEERRSRTPQANSVRDNLDLLLVLDKLAQSRAEMAVGSRSRDDDDGEDDTMKQLLVGMLPAILNRGGGGGGGAPQLPDGMVDQMIEQAFQSPQVIEKIAMKNPQGIAGAFMRAIKSNPALERAVLDAVEKSSDED